MQEHHKRGVLIKKDTHTIDCKIYKTLFRIAKMFENRTSCGLKFHIRFAIFLLVLCRALLVLIPVSGHPADVPTTPEATLQHCDREWNRSMENRRYMYERYQRYGVNTKISLIKANGRFKASGPKVLFIHIGKTCGTSVTHFFRSNRVRYAELHTFPLDMDMITYYEAIVIVIREPLARIISAYNFQHPQGEDPLPPDNREIYKCFDNITELGERVFEDSDCGRLARSDRTTHMGLGYCSYMGGSEIIKNLLKHRNVFIIRAEHCGADSISAAEAILAMLSSSSTQKVVLRSKEMPEIHVKKRKSALEKGLSKTSSDNFRTWLRLSGEEQLYSDLISLRGV